MREALSFFLFFVFGFVPLFFASPPIRPRRYCCRHPIDSRVPPKIRVSIKSGPSIDCWLESSCHGRGPRLVIQCVSSNGSSRSMALAFLFSPKRTRYVGFVVVVVVVVVVLLKSAWICLAEVPDLDWIHRFFNGNGPTWNVKEESIGTTSLLMIFVSMNKSRGGWGGGFDFYD